MKMATEMTKDGEMKKSIRLYNQAATDGDGKWLI